MTAQTQTRKMTKAEAGRLGGKRTAARWGSEHMAEIGRVGNLATVERHFDGDQHAMMERVRAAAVRPNQMTWCPRNLCFVVARS